jgi:homoserine O-acetyltransferase
MTLCCDQPGHPRMQPGWLAASARQLALGDFALESGERIVDAQVSYVMHGELDAQRSNAVLALSAIGSSHHRLDFLIGPGCALDTDRYCVICVDALGNGLSSSPSNSAAQPYQAFPRFTIRDMVATQRAVQQHLRIPRWRAVVGASMGGMQALQWAVSCSDAMEALVAMTPMARTHPWAAAINAAARGALMADPRWAEPGHFSSGLEGWIPIMQLISGRTPTSLQDEFADGSAVRAWLDRRQSWQREQMAAPIDWIWQSHAYDAHDVGTTPGFHGDTHAALASIRTRALVLAPPLDLYNPATAARAVAAGIPGATFHEIPSGRGHQAAGPLLATDAAWLNASLSQFLAA